MFLTHDWRNRWLGLQGSLKENLSLYKTAQLSDEQIYVVIFFFPPQNTTHQGKDLAPQKDIYQGAFCRREGHALLNQMHVIFPESKIYESSMLIFLHIQ